MQSVVPHQHPLLRQPFLTHLVCDVCRKNGGTPGGSCYHCRACDLDICQNCVNQLNMVKNSNHPHQLMITKKRGKFNCDRCKKSFSYEDTVSMNCATCNIDFCMKCYNE